jgi:RNA polymerase primary sigma factor
MRQLKISQSITNRNDKSFEKYLTDIGKNEMINAEEEANLARKIKEGDEEALNRLVNANLRFVVSVAKQYQNQGMLLADLVSEGNIGLIKAAKKFDESRGFKFISYAVWWIRQTILESISEKSRVIRIPLNQVGVMTRINRTYSRLEQELERAPTEKEIADELDINEVKVKENIYSTRSSVSLDSPMGGDSENSSILDVIYNKESPGTDSQVILDSLRIDIERALDSLDTKSSDIIKLYYGIGFEYPRSLEEIGQKYNLSGERVRQIKEKSLKKLRTATKRNLLKTYIG